MKDQLPLILASSSPYRKELLSRLCIPFTCIAPDIDETPFSDESTDALIERLSIEKAQVIAKQHPNAWVIGSDQVADFNGQAIGKPGTHEKALVQLQMMRGKTVVFKTGLCLMNHQSQRSIYICIPTKVTFHDLEDALLENYLHTEKPYDCAGSAKSEGLGICLLSKIKSDDPTALIGLPLISLSGLLRTVGYAIPSCPTASFSQ
jgi:septum formation protein